MDCSELQFFRADGDDYCFFGIDFADTDKRNTLCLLAKTTKNTQKTMTANEIFLFASLLVFFGGMMSMVLYLVKTFPPGK
jgi:hypothetical protein